MTGSEGRALLDWPLAQTDQIRSGVRSGESGPKRKPDFSETVFSPFSDFFFFSFFSFYFFGDKVSLCGPG
jgi:hypothetical protein